VSELEEHGLKWENLCGACTDDDAPVMLGAKVASRNFKIELQNLCLFTP